MKIGILHEELEDSEKMISDVLKQLNHKPDLIDVRSCNPQEIINSGYNLILNRVYASVANRNFSAIKKTLSLIDLLESSNIKVVNNSVASRIDYDKFFSFNTMKSNKISTPETMIISSLDDCFSFAFSAKFPLILKRNTGGRAYDMVMIENERQLLREVLKRVANSDNHYSKQGGEYILQKFVESSANHDLRVCVSDGKINFCHGRTLISNNGEKPWLASITKGSKKIECTLTKKEEDIALRAAEAVGAAYNEIDIMITKQGPYVIEHNPTPNYSKRKELIPVFVKEMLALN